MNKRKFGNTGFDAYPIGFGCMRLPTIEENGTKIIDEKEAIKMLRYAIDNGVNYIDTAYPYHDKNSETVVGKALKDGYREKVKLATKSPVWLINEPDDFDKYLAEQMKKLQTNFIDFYLLHALSLSSWENKVLKHGVLDKITQAKKDGRIGHIGFSYHDIPENYEKILNGFDGWEFGQIQLNYLDEYYQAGINGMNLLAQKGLGIIIMEPLLGGKLANLPTKFTDVFNDAVKGRTCAEWALDYLWDKKEVSIMLSGMSNFQQVKENIEYANRSSIGMFTPLEHKTIKKIQAKFKEIEAVPCTKCQYCMPCPIGVNIPQNFSMINEGHMFENMGKIKEDYKKMKDASGDKTAAINCVDCKKCVSKCPQNINIPIELSKVNKYLA